MSQDRSALPELPQGWVRTTIGEIVTFEYGKGLPKDQRDSSGNVPVYGSNGVVGYHSESLVEEPCLIVGRKGAVGQVHVSTGPCWPIDTTYYVLPPEGIDLSFLCHLLSTVRLAALDKSTTIPGLNRNDAYALPIPLPPAGQQCRIVAKIEELLTQLDAGVAALGKARAQLRRYRQAVVKAAVEGELTKEWREAHKGELEPAAVLLERVRREREKKEEKVRESLPLDTSDLPGLPEGWAWATLPQLGELNRGRSRHRPRNDPKLYGGPYPFIQTGDVRRAGGVIREYSQAYSEEGLRQSRLWPAGTLCITIAANIADTAILEFDACFPDSIVGFLAESSHCNVRFIEYFFRTAKEDIERYAPATAQKNINLRILSSLAIPLPPLGEQQAIVDEVEQRLSVADDIEKTVEQSLKRAERLRQSILGKAFEGKLVSQDLTDEPASVLLDRIKAERERCEAQKPRRRTEKKTRARNRKKKKTQQLELT